MTNDGFSAPVSYLRSRKAFSHYVKTSSVQDVLTSGMAWMIDSIVSVDIIAAFSGC